MVFEKTRELVLVVQPGVKVFAHRPGVPFAKAVVEPLVVGVIESLLLHRPFPVPIDLGHKLEVRVFPPDGLGRLRPEGLSGDAPGAFEHIGQDEHRHVAANAVALSGDSLQFADHRLLQFRVAVVELQRVRPAGEVRIATVGQQHVATLACHPGVVLRRARKVQLAAADVIPEVFLDPVVVQAGVVRDEIEHQPQVAPAEPFAQTGEGGVPAQAFRHRVCGDREPGTGDVLLAQIG